MPDAAAPRDQIDIVQILRAAAAISVTVVHFSELRMMLAGQWTPATPVPLYPAAAGVDLFFAISGFVMVISSERLFGRRDAARTFLGRRIARLVPLYWLATAAAIVVESDTITAETLTKSLLFIPFRAVDGGIHPIFGVGWTLDYEMFFYVLFAATIGLSRSAATGLLCVLLGALAVTGHALHPGAAPLAFWTDPIVVEFALGMAIAIMYRWDAIRLPVPAGAAIVGGALAAIAFVPLTPGLRLLQWGLPASAILAGCVLTRPCRRFPVALLALGDASYSIYLLHTLVAAAVIRLWGHGLNRIGLPATLAGAEVLTIALSLLCYRFFERPAMRGIRRLFSGAIPVAA